MEYVKPLFHCDAKPFAMGPCVVLRPPTPQFGIGDTNMLVSKNVKICVTPNAKHKICVTPNAKPQTEPMEYRLRWVHNAKFFALAIYISCCLCSFHLRWLPNANQVCSGIWALVLLFLRLS